MENPYRGFAPVCICALSIALRFRSCKRGQGNFSHFGWYDKFLRQNWAKWRKIPPRVRVSKGEGSQPLPFWKHPRLPQNIPYPDPCVMMYDHSTGPTAPVVL